MSGQALEPSPHKSQQPVASQRRRRLLWIVAALVIVVAGVALFFYLKPPTCDEWQDAYREWAEAGGVAMLADPGPQESKPTFSPEERERLMDGFTELVQTRPEGDCKSPVP